jgi:hypothetical protein
MDSMAEVLMPLVVLGTMATGTILLTQTLTNYYLRKRMVDKGLIGDDAASMLKKQTESKSSSLKWGLIILFGGIGLIIIGMMDFERDSVLPFGIFAVSLSLGFLVHFLIGNKSQNE